MSRPPLPGDFEDVEFEIEKEGWNTYELKDGVKIRGRVIVLRITKEKNAPPGHYGAQTQNIFVIFAPRSLRGPPSTPPTIEQAQKMERYPVEIVSSNEVWNVYRILRTGDIVRVKLVVTDIYRVKDLYDQLGEPYYLITSGIIVTPGPKESRRVTP